MLQKKENDHSSDPTLNFTILPVRYFLDAKTNKYQWKVKNLRNPVFKEKNMHPTANLRRQSKEKYFGLKTESEFLRKRFFKRVV